MAQYIFFSGKGGVGKTTMASAIAVYYADQNKKTLIVTTDPASNLADVFEQPIGHQIVPIQGVGNLWAVEIEPDAATRQYKERILAPFRAFMPKDVIAALEEQFNSPCTTEIASFDRFVDFMAVDEYDVVIFDTAPTGHTIRLLELPVDWSRHIEEAALGGGQTCIGPVQAIQESKAKYDQATALLKDQARTSFLFVMRPDQLSLYETKRAAAELATIGVKANKIIINGILPSEVCDIKFFKDKFDAQQKVMETAFGSLPGEKIRMLLRNSEVKGLAGLQSVARELFDGVIQSGPATPVSGSGDILIPRPDLDALLLPGQATKLIFFTGKGGVGKTAMSSVAAFYLAQKGQKTLLVTTDPAGHLGEVFGQNIASEPTKVTAGLDAVMIDQQQAFIQYKERILTAARGRFSPDMLLAMEEELNSPCTQEMAAFEQFMKYILTTDYEVVVFDTAPTGHTLRLLNLPFDYARQVEMMVSVSDESSKVKSDTREQYKHVIEILRDRSRSVFALVMYPESTPIIESHRAMLDLQEAGIATQLVIANMVLPDEVCGNDFFQSRRQMQRHYLREITAKFALPVLVYPLLAEEIRGTGMLEKAILHFEAE
ncbi:MAG: TRC40/GET3/ArsA family transport-energizing ATPase [Negativicutes bacterium]|nr:TRC40/GET3/ArsA family transport-energizing ATPase [Negativicutes bacterium]